LLLPSLLLLGLWSCEKDEYKNYLESATAPVLTASTTGPLVLTRANAANTAVRLSWTNPNYRFTTGPSSQDVTYLLQIDKAGQNFSSPIKQEISIAKDLGINWTVTDLNNIITKMDLPENVAHELEMRVRTTVTTGAVPLFSNVIKLTVTPYLDVAVPIPASGRLYITGSATPGNWMGGGDPELATQRFTQVSTSVYEIVVNLSANNSYLFVPVYGNWDRKYGYDGAGNANNVEGDAFREGGNDIKAPSVSGMYKITVNFKTGKFTVVKQ
jgi:hypothetical protein